MGTVILTMSIAGKNHLIPVNLQTTRAMTSVHRIFNYIFSVVEGALHVQEDLTGLWRLEGAMAGAYLFLKKGNISFCRIYLWRNMN